MLINLKILNNFITSWYEKDSFHSLRHFDFMFRNASDWRDIERFIYLSIIKLDIKLLKLQFNYSSKIQTRTQGCFTCKLFTFNWTTFLTQSVALIIVYNQTVTSLKSWKDKKILRNNKRQHKKETTCPLRISSQKIYFSWVL